MGSTTKRCGGCGRRSDDGSAYQRGQGDYAQDRCENAPFVSVGGLTSRADPKRPEYITPADWPAYLHGYTDAAWIEIGPDWVTAEFGWSPALTISPR